MALHNKLSEPPTGVAPNLEAGEQAQSRFQVFPLGSREEKRDLKKRRGGLKVSDPRNSGVIKQHISDILNGSIRDNEAQALIQRNPQAAAVFQSALNRRRQTQQILQGAATPQLGPRLGSGLLQQGAQETERFDPQAAINRARALGRFDLVKQLQGSLPKQTGNLKERNFRSREKDRRFKQERQLRNDFVKQSKPFTDSRDAHGRVLAAAKDPSGAGDLALIFNFMKVLDPKSVVRESEFRTAEVSGAVLEENGVPKDLVRLRDKFFKGTRLSPRQRADFVKRSILLFKKQQAQHKKRVNSTKGIAKRFGLSTRAVVPDLTTPKNTKGVPKSGALTPVQQKRLDALRRKQR